MCDESLPDLDHAAHLDAVWLSCWRSPSPRGSWPRTPPRLRRPLVCEDPTRAQLSVGKRSKKACMFARWPSRPFTSMPSIGAVDVLAVLGVQEGRPVEIRGVVGLERLLDEPAGRVGANVGLPLGNCRGSGVPLAPGNPPPCSAPISRRCQVSAPPLVPHGTVSAPDECVDAVWAPRDRSWRGGTNSTQAFPFAPEGAIPPLVPHGVIGAPDETIEPVSLPRGNGRSRGTNSAQAFPSAPGGTIPPLVPHGAVSPNNKSVDAVWVPGDGGRSGDAHATQAFPLAPRGAIPPLVPHCAVSAYNKAVKSVSLPGSNGYTFIANSA